MIIDKLKQKEYYLSKLTLFMRNSYGIEEQFTIFWKLLIDIDSSIDDIFDALTLLKDIDVDDTLDKLAELVGSKRQLDVVYEINLTPTRFTLNLTNKELLRSIKTRILQNNYFGTYQEFVDNYQKIGFKVLIYDNVNPNTVSIVLNDSTSLTENDRHMFLSGNYTIRSMGIEYIHFIQSIELLGVWNNLTSTYDSNTQWGE